MLDLIQPRITYHNQHSHPPPSIICYLLISFRGNRAADAFLSLNTYFSLLFLHTDKYIGSLVKLDIAQTMVALLRRMLSDCGLNPKLGSVPVQV